MNYLLDVNVLVAWGWADHAEHDRVARWIGKVRKQGEDGLLTSAIPQLGFVRVSVQRTGGQVTPETAGEVLREMLRSLDDLHEFIPDDQETSRWPTWCKAASRMTDAHLLALAKAHGAELATLDRGIPDAFVIS
ncbi:MAG: TA system VapC family ribonuclease toxin [Verrucomicrobiota bacterium]